jgi:competence ComEA-like helix-hairpin-helix protein
MFKSKHLLFLCCFGLLLSMSACASHPTKVPVVSNKVTTTKVVKAKTEKTKVNINKANFKTLKTVKGIGSKRASAILHYRAKHGAFKNINELRKLKGKGYNFSKKYIESIAHLITV